MFLAHLLMFKFNTARLGAAGGISGATIGAFASFVFLVLIYIKDRKTRNVLIEKS